MKILRILHVVTYMGRGGLETMIMNYYRHIDRTKVQFDFLVHRSFEADYDQEIFALGGRIYRLPRLNPLDKKYIQKLDDFFREHKEYNIVHSHLDCMAAIPLKYAKNNGIPIRVAHAHSSNQTKDEKYILKLLYKRKIKKYANYFFACGKDAGKWMFGDVAFKVLNNAIDGRKYVYDATINHIVREELGIPQDAAVIGHVGRFAPPKNHKFIVKVFVEVMKKQPNTFLLLVGDGELKEAVATQVRNLGISEHVLFTGIRTDVERLLQVMNVFLFPSIYEGLPVSIIEAQAAGVPCLISDKVPSECKKTTLVKQISLEDTLEKWSSSVIEASKTSKRNTYHEIQECGFDICENAKWLENFYIALAEKVKEGVRK